jgi:hypothetical protein
MTISEHYTINDGCLDIEKGRLLKGGCARQPTPVPEVTVVAILPKERIVERSSSIHLCPSWLL